MLRLSPILTNLVFYRMALSQLHISVLGDRFSFHHLAALARYGENHTFLFRPQFDELIEDVQSGKSDICLIAVDNTLAGEVPGNYERITESGLNVQAEVNLQIQLLLGALPGVSINEIEAVYSHRMGILETTGFFKQYPGLRFESTNSTTEAAKLVAARQLLNAGVVAGRRALLDAGLEVLTGDISNNALNITRFLVLSAKSYAVETTKKMLKASLQLHFHDDQAGRQVKGLPGFDEILFEKRLNNRDSYAEAAVTHPIQFGHVPVIIETEFCRIRVLGLYEVAGTLKEP